MFANLGLGERANQGLLTELFFGYWTYPKNVMIKSAILCFLNRFLQIVVLGYYGIITYTSRGYEHLEDSQWSLNFWGDPNGEGGYRHQHLLFFNDSGTFTYCDTEDAKCITPHFPEMHQRTENEFFASTFFYEQSTLHVPCNNPLDVIMEHNLVSTVIEDPNFSCMLPPSGYPVAISANGTEICLCGTIRPFFIVGTEEIQFEMQHSYWKDDLRYEPGTFKTELIDAKGEVRKTFSPGDEHVSISLAQIMDYIGVGLEDQLSGSEKDSYEKQNIQPFCGTKENSIYTTHSALCENLNSENITVRQSGIRVMVDIEFSARLNEDPIARMKFASGGNLNAKDRLDYLQYPYVKPGEIGYASDLYFARRNMFGISLQMDVKSKIGTFDSRGITNSFLDMVVVMSVVPTIVLIVALFMCGSQSLEIWEAVFSPIDGTAEMINLYRRNIRGMMAEFDYGGDGTIQSEELYHALRSFNPLIRRSDIALVMRQIDKNGDGTLTYDELFNFCYYYPLHSLTRTIEQTMLSMMIDSPMKERLKAYMEDRRDIAQGIQVDQVQTMEEQKKYSEHRNLRKRLQLGDENSRFRPRSTISGRRGILSQASQASLMSVIQEDGSKRRSSALSDIEKEVDTLLGRDSEFNFYSDQDSSDRKSMVNALEFLEHPMQLGKDISEGSDGETASD